MLITVWILSEILTQTATLPAINLNPCHLVFSALLSEFTKVYKEKEVLSFAPKWVKLIKLLEPNL